MNRESLTARDSRAILMVLIISAVSVTGYPARLGQDTWAGLLCSMLAVVPLSLLYVSMSRRAPGQDLYGMVRAAFGAGGARISGLLFGLFFIYQAASVLGSHTQFIHLTTLPRTPLAVIALAVALPCVYLAHSGARALGKWCLIAMVSSFLALFVMTALSASQLDLRHLLPVLARPAEELARQSAQIACLPFGDILLFLALGGGLERDAKPSRVYFGGVGLGLFFLLVSFVRTCALLGAGFMERVYFQNYTAVSLLQVGPFLERIEAFLALVYLMAGFGKLAACLLAAAKGAQTLFARPSYQTLVFPVCAAALGASLLFWRDALDMLKLTAASVRYTPIFFAALPLIIWLGLLLRKKKPALRAPLGG